MRHESFLIKTFKKYKISYMKYYFEVYEESVRGAEKIYKKCARSASIVQRKILIKIEIDF